MKIVVIGYGRVGSRTVAALLERGHQITLIDKEASRLGRASNLEGVELVQGNGIDVDVQREAGIGDADILLAVTFDDNVNLMAAQVARSHFHVPRAIARVYEPSHAEATQEDPQLIVVCPTLLAVTMIVEQVDIAAKQPLQDRIPVEPIKASRRPRFDATDESRYKLIAGQVAKKVFGVPKAIARASNPKNEEVMARLGVDSTVSSTAIIQQVIERELPTVRIKTLLSLQAGSFQILEYPLDGTSPAAGRLVREIDLPLESNLIAILRGNTMVIPRGETKLNEGDVVVVLVNTDEEAQLRLALLGA